MLRQYSLADLLELYQQKFKNHDAFFVIRSLTYFDDAEMEPDPVLLTKISWATVKAELVKQVAKLV